jgi:Helix-turn-helix domain
MTIPNSMPTDRRLRLKKPNGWFPAGEGFLQAMTQLSGGAFKLFVFLCLNADRQTAAYTVSQRSLASAIGKSKPATEEYIAELKTKGFCSVRPSRIPYVGTSFRINEKYWPYQSANGTNAESDSGDYVNTARDLFLGLGCTSGRFGPPEAGQARNLEKRGISLQELEDAMIVGACRKYVSWLNNGPSDSIASLRYFESLIEEIRERPFPPGYRDYLRMEVKKLAGQWQRARDQNRKSLANASSETVSSNSKTLQAPSEKETR